MPAGTKLPKLRIASKLRPKSIADLDALQRKQRRQRTDLATAKKWVRLHHPATEVATYFAFIEEERVVFDACG